MLEELLEFKESMRENKSKRFVKRKFIKYCIKYNKIENPMKNEISSYKSNLLDYIRFMNKSGDGK